MKFVYQLGLHVWRISSAAKIESGIEGESDSRVASGKETIMGQSARINENRMVGPESKLRIAAESAENRPTLILPSSTSAWTNRYPPESAREKDWST